jgi:pilus assembly protein Flp/PilA
MTQLLAKAAANVETQLKNLTTRDEGATMVEYGLMVALIAVVCLAAVTLLGTSINDIFTEISGSMSTSG